MLKEVGDMLTAVDKMFSYRMGAKCLVCSWVLGALEVVFPLAEWKPLQTILEQKTSLEKQQNNQTKPSN